MQSHSDVTQVENTYKTDELNNNATINIDNNLAHDHRYNELNPTLICVGKNSRHHPNMLQTSTTNETINSNSNRTEHKHPSKGIFELEKTFE